MKTELIVALDVGDIKKAKKLVEILQPAVKFFKVGSFLFTSCGPDIVKWLKQKRLKVFLDLKLYDIPNTVASTAKAITGMGVSMFTIHASGGAEMIRACVDAVKAEARRLKIEKPKIIAVTVLTSSNPRDVKIQVSQLASQALHAGADGLVCSVQEARMLRKKFSHSTILVCPGIRLASAGSADQKRVATPRDAKKAGADFIVAGRPIIEAESPFDAAVDIARLLK